MSMKPTDWMTEIDNGLDYRELFAREAAWKRLEQDYLHDPNGDTAIGSNLIFSQGDALISSLCVPDPEIVVTAEHPDGVNRAPKVEAVDNWFIKKLKMKRAVDLALTHCYLFSRAIIKLGYDSEFGFDPYWDIGKNGPVGITLTQFNKKGNRIEFGDVSPGMPWFKTVSPHDIVVPWGTIYIDEAPWVAHRIIRLNTSIKSDAKYENSSKLEPNVSMDQFVNSYNIVGVNKERLSSTHKKFRSTTSENSQVVYNELWEIHDRSDNTIKVICFDHDEYLRNDKDAIMSICGMPFVSGTFVQHPRSFWSTPLAYYLGALQASEFDISKQEEKQRRINTLKFLIAKGLLSEDKLTRFLSGDVGAAEITDRSGDLRESIIPFPQGNSLDFVMQHQANAGSAREIVGLSRNQAGEYDIRSRRTAREAQFVQMGSERRSNRRADVVSDLYLGGMEKLNKLAFSLWKLPRWITAGDGNFVKMSGDEIEGDYLYDMSLSTKRQIGRAQRQIEALMLLPQLAAMPGMKLEQVYQYLINASGSTAFEALLESALGNAPTGQGIQGPAVGAPPQQQAK